MGESSDGASGARKLGLSSEEIEKVKKEWEETQKKKGEKEMAKKKEKEKEAKDKEKDKEEGKESFKDTKPMSSAPTPVAPTPVARTPTHQRFTLHRDMFALRLSEHRKRRQAAQAKELAPRFPGAPLGGF